MTKRVGIIGSSSSATTLPGWNDYEFQQLERIFLNEGVFEGIGNEFNVVERAAGANMTVDVQSGRALIEITNTNIAHDEVYKIYFDSDATESVNVPVADNTNPRKDRIVLRIDVSTDPDGSTGNIAIIELLEGTPAGSPTAPATPANAISLAIVDVPAGDTAIENAQITDDRTYVDLKTDKLASLPRFVDLASTATNKGAALIGVEDTENNFASSTVEGALADMFHFASAKKGIGTLGDGNQGTAAWTANTNLDPTFMHQYTDGTLDAGVTLSVSSVNTPLIIAIQGNMVFNGNLNLDGKGGPGGAGGAFETNGQDGTDGHSIDTTDLVCGGGRGGGYTAEDGAGGGSGASMLGDGTAGQSTNTGSTGGAAGEKGSGFEMLASTLRGVACGGGGGGAAGSQSGGGAGGDGGDGGGAAIIFVGGDLTLGASSSISVDGLDGSDGAGAIGYGGGGGGAGSGGSVLIIVSGSITDNGVSFSAVGGDGGAKSSFGGGDGGDGRKGKVLIHSIADGTTVAS